MKIKKVWAQVQEEHKWEDAEEWKRLSQKTTTMVKISIQYNRHHHYLYHPHLEAIGLSKRWKIF
jgi:hypothetical protein